VGISISYPLYDAGQRRLALQAREEAVERAREQLAQAEQDVRSRVADLFVQLEDARRDVEIASLDLRRAELEMAAVLRQAELAVAAAGQDDVERTRRNVVRAELSYLEAVQRYQARWIELQRLQGPVPWEQLLGAAAGGEVWR
jgi:Outer membrane protein